MFTQVVQIPFGQYNARGICKRKNLNNYLRILILRVKRRKKYFEKKKMKFWTKRKLDSCTETNVMSSGKGAGKQKGHWNLGHITRITGFGIV